jgi:glycosyltransferase involved in cell wall biosynthesis
MSHSCIEAMACGLPVVYLTEGTGVLEEVVGPGGIRCATMGEVKAAVMRLLNDPAESAEIGKRGREQAKLWDKDRMVKEYDILFKECAG